MTTYLEERIEWYDHNYRMGTPLISDAKFDQLESIYIESILKLITLQEKQYDLYNYYLKNVLKNL